MTFASRIALCSALALTATATEARQAEICYSPSVPFDQAVPPTNSTVFNCPGAGALTLPQLAALGWEVVQLGPLVAGSNQQTDQLVIEKP